MSVLDLDWVENVPTAPLPLQGRQFGTLKAIRSDGSDRWVCRCSQCGGHPSVSSATLLSAKKMCPECSRRIGKKKNGYRYVWQPQHINAQKDGFIPEHRLIASEVLQRPLAPGETVHHLGERDDNRPSQLGLRIQHRQPTLDLMSKRLADGLGILSMMLQLPPAQRNALKAQLQAV